MRRITLWLLSTVVAVVLLFSYRTSTMGSGSGGTIAAGAPAAPPGSGGTSSSGPSSDGTSSGGTSSDDAPSTGSPSSGPSASPDSGSGSSGSGSSGKTSGTKTYAGSTAQTRWGPVQVTITVANHKITNVAVPVYPTGNFRDQEINAYALPILQQETIAAQSADIDTVSGATVTSEGYIESLQAALDAAHL